jgi:hypothetical protein
LTDALRKRKPTALGALLEITIVMAMGIAVIGAYRGWFNPSDASPTLPVPPVKAQLGHRPERQTGLLPNRCLGDQRMAATSTKGMSCC